LIDVTVSEGWQMSIDEQSDEIDFEIEGRFP
jgi:hypothetical protein